jgi:cysteine desulfurase
VLKAALRPDTILVSVMLVNNEIGVIQDVAAIGALCRERGVLLHVDAAQASGKVAIDLGRLPVDLMSLSAHKTYGPKGVGALYVRRKPRVRIEALIHGGGHERGMRSGTLPTHQIVGMGEAYRLCREGMAGENDRIRGLRDRLLAGLQAIPETRVNGSLLQRVPHNLNISFQFVEGESLLMGMKASRCRRARPAPRPAWSPATCCARWACPTRSRTARSASRSAASPPPPRSTPRSNRSSTPSSGCAT